MVCDFVVQSFLNWCELCFVGIWDYELGLGFEVGQVRDIGG